MTKFHGIIDENGFPVIPEVILINPLKNIEFKPKSIIDTGAIGLHIKTDVIKLLELERMDGTYTLHPIHGRQPIDIFEVKLGIQGIDFGLIPVKTMLSDFPFDMIIGTIFIREGKMVYDGLNKAIEITI